MKIIKIKVRGMILFDDTYEAEIAEDIDERELTETQLQELIRQQLESDTLESLTELRTFVWKNETRK